MGLSLSRARLGEHTLAVQRFRLSGPTLVGGAVMGSLLAVLIGLQSPVLRLQMSAADPLEAWLAGLVSLSLVLTGCHLLTSGRQRSNGWLVATAGGLWLLTSMRLELGPLVFLQWVVTPLPIGILALVLLRYPDARLTRRSVSRFAILLIGWLFVGRLVDALLWEPTWGGAGRTWWPTVWRSAEAYTSVSWLYHGGCAILAAAFLVLVAGRLGRSSGLMRLRTWPTAALGPTAAVAFGLQSVGWLLPLPEDVSRFLTIATDGALLAIPGSFALIALQHRLERTRVADAVIQIGRGATPEQIRDALRSAVAEPGLELAFRRPDTAGWVDAAGRSVALGELSDRLLIPIDDSEGEPLAVVATHLGMAAHRDVLDPAVTAVRLSLENLRLQAVALARLEEVTQSRLRLVTAGIEERRKVERDLHDGAQQRLLAVAASLSRARERTSDPASRAVLDTARGDLRVALAELRQLAAGLHPAVLKHSGLAAALGSVAERLPVGIRTDVEARRWPADIEMTAYFVACECLTNVVKHSGADSATVSASQRDGYLLLTVEDDGAGGAVPTRGRGLNGLTDRVAAFGGTLSIDSAPGHGTRVEAALPCV